MSAPYDSPLTVQMLAKASRRDKEPMALRVEVDTWPQAARQVQLHIHSGWRELTADVVDREGELVGCYDFEAGWIHSPH